MFRGQGNEEEPAKATEWTVKGLWCLGAMLPLLAMARLEYDNQVSR